MPNSARSVTDQENRIIYIPLREELDLRAARSVVLQTLGHYALDHSATRDFGDYLRQRVESNYFAAAALIPEQPAIDLLQRSFDLNDLSIEDLKEAFYVSYEMPLTASRTSPPNTSGYRFTFFDAIPKASLRRPTKTTALTTRPPTRERSKGCEYLVTGVFAKRGRRARAS